MSTDNTSEVQEFLKKKIITELGKTYEELGFALSCSRMTIWRRLNKQPVDQLKLKRIADEIEVDLRKHFDNYDLTYSQGEVPAERISREYQDKYRDLLEKYHVLLEKYEALSSKETET